MRIGTVAVLLGCAVCLTGCVNHVAVAINKYHEASPRVQLGMERDPVLLALKPSQVNLPLRERKESEQYFEMTEGKERFVEIFFFRSHVNYDGILTDDEFTPYIFHDGKLVAIGWTAIGGPKTQAQSRPEQHIHVVR